VNFTGIFMEASRNLFKGAVKKIINDTYGKSLDKPNDNHE